MALKVGDYIGDDSLPPKGETLNYNADDDDNTFHLRPENKISDKAWMNIVLSPGEGYDRPIRMTLTQAEIHNIIIMLTKVAVKFGGIGSDTSKLYERLAAKLEHEWVKSIMRWTDQK